MGLVFVALRVPKRRLTSRSVLQKEFNSKNKKLTKQVEELSAQITTIETQLAEAKAVPPHSTVDPNTATASSDPANSPAAPVAQEVIDSAVQEAVIKLQISHEEALAARERELREELALLAPPAVEGSSSEPASTVDVDLAVKTALTTREKELEESYAAQLAAREQELVEKTHSVVEEAVKAAIAAIPPPPASATAELTPTDPRELKQAVKAAVEAREAELNRVHEETLKAAMAAASTSTPASAVPEDEEARKAEIATAVQEAVDRERREAASKTAAQKGALDRIKTQKADLAKENASLKQQLLEAQPSTPVLPSPATGPAKGGRAIPIPPRPAQASTSTPAAASATSTPTGPTTRQRASIGGSAVPTTPAAAGTSIRGASTAGAGAGRGRGGGTPSGPSTRGGATAATAPRGGAAATRGGRKAPGGLFGGGESFPCNLGKSSH